MKDKMVAAGILATIALGVPLVLQPVFSAADTPQIIEGCHWDGKDWIYWDQTMCRGTGEDPTTNSQGRPICADQIPPSLEPNGRVMCLTV